MICYRMVDYGFENSDAMEMRHVLSSLPQADVQRWVFVELILILPPAKNDFVWLYRNHPVCLCVCPTVNTSLNERILINICTVAEYNLRMCMKKDIRGLKYFKGDN